MVCRRDNEERWIVVVDNLCRDDSVQRLDMRKAGLEVLSRLSVVSNACMVYMFGGWSKIYLDLGTGQYLEPYSKVKKRLVRCLRRNCSAIPLLGLEAKDGYEYCLHFYSESFYQTVSTEHRCVAKFSSYRIYSNETILHLWDPSLEHLLSN